MKRIARILLVVMVLAFAMAPMAFAAEGGLEVIEEHPAADSTSTPPTNVGIKLYFNGEFTNKELRKSNSKLFTLQGPVKEVPVRVLFSDQDKNYILIIAEPDNETISIGENKEFTLTVDGALQADDGSTLGENYALTFSTRDTSNDTTVNMVMMGIMFVGIIGFSVFQSRKKAKEDVASGKKEEKFNPYKVAKETGKPVEQVIAEHEKKKARQAKKLERKQKEDEEKALAERNTYQVKEPRPIAAAGGKYKPPKKQKPKNESGQSKKNNQQNKNNQNKKGNKKKR